MAGLLDMFSGGDNQSQGALGLYGDALSPEQKQALAYRGLLGFLGGMQKSGALDYTAPFLSGKVPAGFAAGLAGGAGAMGEAQDAGALNAMRGGLLGLQAKELQGKLGLYNSAAQPPPSMYGAPAAAGSATSGPPGAAGPANPQDALSLIKDKESNGDYNVGFGGVDLSNAPKDEFGFPIWEGKQGPAGTTHAAGAYQFEPATWKQYAGPLGIKDFSPASQDLVAKAAYLDQGFAPWAPYNPRLAAAIQSGAVGGGQPPAAPPAAGGTSSSGVGSGNGLPFQPPGLLAQNAPQAPQMPAGGLLPQPAPNAVPPITLPSAPAAAAPGMMPGGAAGQQISPAYIQWAQQQARIRSALGVPVPADIAEAAKLPLVGPTKTAEEAAAFPFQRALKRSGFENVRGGSSLVDLESGQPTFTAPQIQKVTDPNTGQESYSYMSPNGTQPTGQVAALGPGQRKTLENSAAVQPLTLQTPVTGTGPGYTAPLKSDAGTVIPPAIAATPIQGPKEYLDERAKEYSKVETEWGNSVASAAEARQRMVAITSALKQYQSGSFASHLSEIRADLKAAGINLPDSVAGDPAQAQIILKNNFAASIQTMKATGLSRWTQAELFSSQKNMANPDLQPEANLSIASQTVGALDWEQQMQRDFSQAKKYGGFLDPQDFQRQWVQANPIQPFIEKAEKEMGPLKGMPNAPQPKRFIWDQKAQALRPVQ